MRAIELKHRLSKIQPYFIEKDLLPYLYFKEELQEDITDPYGNYKDIEYWIFYYTFIRKLTTVCIGIRLNFTQQNIHKRLLSIIKNNRFLIENFLESCNTVVN